MGSNNSSYQEYMPVQSFPESYEGVENERVIFEKKIRFLILLRIMGQFNFFGSAKKQDLSKLTITRNDIKAYLESYELSANNLKYAQDYFPEKIIKAIKKSNFYDLELDKKIMAEQKYIDDVYPYKCELIRKIYSEMNQDEKKITFNKLIEFMSLDELLKKFIGEFYSDNMTEEKAKKFFDETGIFCENLATTCAKCKISPTLCHNWLKLFNAFNALNESNSNHNNLFDFYVGITMRDIFKCKMNEMDFDKMNNFVIKCLQEMSNDKVIKFSSSLNVGHKLFTDKINGDKQFRELDMITKHEIFKTKYYNELDEETKKKHTLYFLDFDTYYQIFRMNEKVFTDVLCYNELVDDWTPLKID